MAILPIFIPHAGCPHHCIFCNQNLISGQNGGELSGAQKQIEFWRQYIVPSRTNEAAFYGGSFTGLEKEVQQKLLALTDALISEGFIGSVRVSTRPDYINAEELKLLKEHKVVTVELGVQSLDDAVLKIAERGHTSGHVFWATSLLRKNDFKIGFQLMVGLPGQSDVSVFKTAELCTILKPDIARIYPVLVVKNTKLAALYLKKCYQPLSLEEAVTQSAKIYEIFTHENIKVIRVGLQPDEELCAPGNILSGPFHPAMGELVKGRVRRNKLTPTLYSLYKQGENFLEIRCPFRLQSQVRGLSNCNMLYWKEIMPELSLRVIVDETALLPYIKICRL